MKLEEIENQIVELEKQRKVMLQTERPLVEEKADIKMAMARLKVRVYEIDKALEQSKHELDINNINLSLKKKEFWSLKSELGV